jgi:hypothetical protein
MGIFDGLSEIVENLFSDIKSLWIIRQNASRKR